MEEWSWWWEISAADIDKVINSWSIDQLFAFPLRFLRLIGNSRPMMSELRELSASFDCGVQKGSWHPRESRKKRHKKHERHCCYCSTQSHCCPGNSQRSNVQVGHLHCRSPCQTYVPNVCYRRHSCHALHDHEDETHDSYQRSMAASYRRRHTYQFHTHRFSSTCTVDPVTTNLPTQDKKFLTVPSPFHTITDHLNWSPPDEPKSKKPDYAHRSRKKRSQSLCTGR